MLARSGYLKNSRLFKFTLPPARAPPPTGADQLGWPGQDWQTDVHHGGMIAKCFKFQPMSRQPVWRAAVSSTMTARAPPAPGRSGHWRRLSAYLWSDAPRLGLSVRFERVSWLEPWQASFHWNLPTRCFDCTPSQAGSHGYPSRSLPVSSCQGPRWDGTPAFLTLTVHGPGCCHCGWQ
jgi:hypothetical protein